MRDIVVAFIVAIVVGGLTLLGQRYIDDERATREARAENLQFVRDVSVSYLLAQDEVGSAAPVETDTPGGDGQGPSNDEHFLPLSGIDLQDQVLAGLNLRNADLSGANLAGVDFSGAVLINADFRNATMTAVHLSGASMEFTDFNYVRLDDASISGSNLHAAQFNLSTATYLNRASTGFAPNIFSGAQFLGTDLTGSDLAASDFTDALLDGATMRQVNLRDSDFSGAILRDTDFSYANLQGVDFGTAEFGVNVILTGICWTDATIWPPGGETPPGKAETCAPAAGEAWQPQ